MLNDEQILGKLLAWADALGAHALPAWADFPALPLYMDQVILLMNGYLAFPDAQGDEKNVTPAMINNYVKLKIIPPPVKKRYTRVHLSYLVMVCLLKQAISTAEIKKLLPLALTEEETQQLYQSFLDTYETAKAGFLSQARAALREGLPSGEAPLVFQYAALASLSMRLAREALAGMPENGKA